MGNGTNRDDAQSRLESLQDALEQATSENQRAAIIKEMNNLPPSEKWSDKVNNRPPSTQKNGR